MPLAPDLLLLSRRRKASCVNARHSSEGWNPVLALNFFEVQGFHSPCGRACYFLCLCKESNQRNTPPVARSPGILPSECASGFRGSLSAHPCARSARARFLRAPLRAFPPPARRATGGPVWAASCRRSNRSHCLFLRQVCPGANDRIGAVQGCTGSCTNRRRSRCRASQGAAENARRGARTMRARRLRAHGRALSRPRRTREAQGSPIRTMRIGPPRPVPSLLVTFGQCQK